MALPLRISAWTVDKPGPEQGRWRGFIARQDEPGVFTVTWTAPQTRETRAAAVRDAKAHARKISP